MYFTYILKSSINGTYYIGCTSNIDRRLKEHNKGTSKFTRKYRPWALVLEEKFETLGEARSRETYLKSWKKRERLEKLFNK